MTLTAIAGDSSGHEVTSIDQLLAGGAPPSQAPGSATPLTRRSGHLMPMWASCDDAENPSSYKWGSELPVKWWTVTANNVDTDPVPSYLDQGLTLTNERNAHTEWTSNDNGPCGVPDNTSFTTSYQGIDNGCGICFAHDGKSRLMWGNNEPKGGDSSSLAITQEWYDQNLGTIIESDTMIDTDGASSPQSKPWTNGLVSGRYDIWSTVAHETGHLAGFEHVTNPNNVMNKYGYWDDIDPRQLGKGDAKENNAKY
jgi:hypothetical protein